MKNFYKPTPLKWRKIGDALLASSLVVATYSAANDYKWTGVAAMAMGVIGKFLSNLFSE
jgi:hypothetical protein